METQHAPAEGPAGVPERYRSSIPLVVVAGALVVAVAAVSVLIFVLFKKTTGPGQVVRAYYSAVAARDCGAAYGDLAPAVRARVSRGRFCDALAGSGPSPTGVVIETVTGCGEPPARFALVRVRELGSGAASSDVEWELVRIGGSWRISAFPAGRGPLQDLPPEAGAPPACRAPS
jgi:hypothetical protein